MTIEILCHWGENEVKISPSLRGPNHTFFPAEIPPVTPLLTPSPAHTNQGGGSEEKEEQQTLGGLGTHGSFQRGLRELLRTCDCVAERKLVSPAERDHTSVLASTGFRAALTACALGAPRSLRPQLQCGRAQAH